VKVEESASLVVQELEVGLGGGRGSSDFKFLIGSIRNSLPNNEFECRLFKGTEETRAGGTGD
jgi:hypothetical protein